MPCHVSNVPACSAVVVPVTLSSFLGVILWHNIYRGSLASQYVYDRNGFILKLQKLKLEFFSFFKKSKILDKKCFCSINLGFIELDWIYRNIPKHWFGIVFHSDWLYTGKTETRHKDGRINQESYLLLLMYFVLGTKKSKIHFLVVLNVNESITRKKLLDCCDEAQKNVFGFVIISMIFLGMTSNCHLRSL